MTAIQARCSSSEATSFYGDEGAEIDVVERHEKGSGRGAEPFEVQFLVRPTVTLSCAAFVTAASRGSWRPFTHARVPSTTWIGIFTWSTILTKSGIDRGVVASALSLTPITTSSADIRPPVTIGATLALVALATVSFSARILSFAIRPVYFAAIRSVVHTFAAIPRTVAGASLTAFPVSPYSTPAGALAVPRAASVITVPVCVE